MAEVTEIGKTLIRLIDPMKWKAMRDYQRGWYWQLTLKMTYMVPVGRLPFDGQLWTLAGAHSRQYWDANNGLVLACFRVAEIGGQKWILHEELIRLIDEQKRALEVTEIKTSCTLSTSETEMLGEFFLSFYKNYPRKIQKKAAKKAFLKAVKEHSREIKAPVSDSAEFITHRSTEFAAATERAGTDKKFIPYPATWLNKGGFLDDPSEWVVNATVEPATKAEQKLQQSFTEIESATRELAGRTPKENQGEISSAFARRNFSGVVGRLAKTRGAGGD